MKEQDPYTEAMAALLLAIECIGEATYQLKALNADVGGTSFLSTGTADVSDRFATGPS